MDTGFYTENELKEMGLKTVGTNVLISRKASIYAPHNISIGNNVRIDDFCVILGNVTIGDYVHICIFSSLHASLGEIVIGNFVEISSHCSVHSTTDVTTPDAPATFFARMFPKQSFKSNSKSTTVVIGDYADMGIHATILPGGSLGEGAVLGAMSLATKKLDPWSLYMGVPAKKMYALKPYTMCVENGELVLMPKANG
jgi:galactoside O-acetyltransferase